MRRKFGCFFCFFNLRDIRVQTNGINNWIDGLGGMKEAVEGIVGRLQVKEHLAHLVIIQLV